MHASERSKPTNTGYLAHQCLENSEVRLRGDRSQVPVSLDGLVDDSYETWLLTLSDRSQFVSDVNPKKPVRLLVPDGNWSQASRHASQLAKKLPSALHVKLSAGGKPSQYRLRSEHHPDGMATFEAIARTLGLLEGAHIQEPMEALFRRMTDRVLFSRGQLAADQVFGGL